MSSVDTALQPAVARDQARALFGQTMGLVAVTTGLFALGAYLGRDLSYGWGFVWYIASFGVLFALNYAASRSEQLAIGLLFGFGVLVGLGTAPVIAYYASTNPQSVWQAGGRPRSSSPASARPVTPRAATSQGSPACASGRCSR